MVMKKGEPSKFIGRGALQLTGKKIIINRFRSHCEDCAKNPDLN
jgi:predicted chitinase